MSSSTSSFRTELKVIALVLLALCGYEGVMRIFEKRFSLNLATASVANNMAQGEKPRVLFLGNSLVRYDLDLHAFEEELRAQQLERVTPAQVSPFNTLINDWYYVFKHNFVDTGQTPDMLVICFAGNYVQDTNYLQRPLIARYYTGVRDMPEIFSSDVRDFDGRVDFLLSKISPSFFYRTSVRRRLLTLVVPHYEESVRRMNRSPVEQRSEDTVHTQPGYRRLERLIGMAQSRGVRVVLVAMPLRRDYPIDPQLQGIVETAGATYIDTRTVEGLSAESFEDAVHLKSSGATVYSRFLARRLAREIKQISDK